MEADYWGAGRLPLGDHGEGPVGPLTGLPVVIPPPVLTPEIPIPELPLDNPLPKLPWLLLLPLAGRPLPPAIPACAIIRSAMGS